MAWVPEGEKEQDSARQSAGNKRRGPSMCPGVSLSPPPAIWDFENVLQ